MTPLISALVEPRGNGIDVVEAVLLFFGMALIGVRILGLLSPLVGAVVTRTLPETAWDGVMLLYAQGSAALVTFWIGMDPMGGPWYAAATVGFLVGITTFAVRSRRPYYREEGVE